MRYKISPDLLSVGIKKGFEIDYVRVGYKSHNLQFTVLDQNEYEQCRFSVLSESVAYFEPFILQNLLDRNIFRLFRHSKEFSLVYDTKGTVSDDLAIAI